MPIAQDPLSLLAQNDRLTDEFISQLMPSRLHLVHVLTLIVLYTLDFNRLV